MIRRKVEKVQTISGGITITQARKMKWTKPYIYVKKETNKTYTGGKISYGEFNF